MDVSKNVSKHRMIVPCRSNTRIFANTLPHTRCEMKDRMALLAVFAVVTLSLFMNPPVYAQSAQTVNNVNLRFLNVQLTYPAQALPGQSVTVNVQAKAKSSFELASFMVQIYIADPNSPTLRQLTSTVVAQSLEMSSGGLISKAIQVAVPSDVPRTSLIAQVSENVTLTVFIVYINSNPAVAAAPYNTASFDDAITPLTYIAATTPEYVALQSQYQDLQTKNQQMQQGLTQSLSQIVSLQSLLSQQNATINALNGQLNYESRRVTTYQAVAVGMTILAAIFLVLYVRQRRKG